MWLHGFVGWDSVSVQDGFASAISSEPVRCLDATTLRVHDVVWHRHQVLASVFGFGLIAAAEGVFPAATGFAAGAMLAVDLRAPSSHGHGYADVATAA